MKINENTLLERHKVGLVPYNVNHVPRCHERMKQPPNLEQEYDMKGSWREDDDKCTFLILNKQRWGDPSIEEEQCMVGDVNMFLTDPTDFSSAELEIMIAGDAQINLWWSRKNKWKIGMRMQTFVVRRLAE
uniref:Uncharacterized protein n=1 Tax=Monopterus albus TaxID=43700 RepID=A0A3Q3KDL2_MONAL